MQVPEHRRTVAKTGTGLFIRSGRQHPSAEHRRVDSTLQSRTHTAKPDADGKTKAECPLPDAPLILRLCKPLFNLDLARGGGGLLDLLLGNVDGHHTVFDLGRNILALDIVGQQQALLELRVGEFAAQ